MTAPLVLFVKAHVGAYTRKDGTFVAEHDDSRMAAKQRPASGIHLHAKTDQHEHEFVGREKLKSEAKKLGKNEFLDRFSAQQLPEHMDHGLHPAKVIHDKVHHSSLDPTEWDDWNSHKTEDFAGGEGSNAKVKKFAEHLKRGGSLPPVLVSGDSSGADVIDGHHRAAAHIEAGKSHVPVVYENRNLLMIWGEANGINVTEKWIYDTLKQYKTQHLPEVARKLHAENASGSASKLEARSPAHQKAEEKHPEPPKTEPNASDKIDDIRSLPDGTVLEMHAEGISPVKVKIEGGKVFMQRGGGRGFMPNPMTDEGVSNMLEKRSPRLLQKSEQQVVLFAKAHVRGHVKKDGTVVRPYENKKPSATHGKAAHGQPSLFGFGSWGGKPPAPPKGSMTHPKKNDDGHPVTINVPHKPTAVETWTDPDAVATFLPHGAVPDALYGVPFVPWDDHPRSLQEWADVPGQADLDEPELAAPAGKHVSAGVVIEEADGRVWVVHPTNAYGGYRATFAKGTQDDGLSLQATAIKEAFEETGLQVEITGLVGDYERTTSVGRYYLARRVGGSPSDCGWESQAISLVPRDQLYSLLNRDTDHPIAEDVGAGPVPEKPAPGKLF